MAYTKARTSTDSVNVASMFYARAVIAAQKRNMNPGKWVEEAIHELDMREKRECAEIDFREEQVCAAHNRQPTPDREQFFKMRGLT